MTTIFVLSRASFFSDGLRLLLEKAGLRLVGRESDPETALERLQDLLPDAVIVAEEQAESFVVRALARALTKRIVLLQKDSNTVHVYRRGSCEITRVEDLIQAIVTDAEK